MRPAAHRSNLDSQNMLCRLDWALQAYAGIAISQYPTKRVLVVAFDEAMLIEHDIITCNNYMVGKGDVSRTSPHL